MAEGADCKIRGAFQSYTHQPSKKMTVEEQIKYLFKSQKRLIESIMKIQPDTNLLPATVNLTYSDQVSKRKGKDIGFVESLSSTSEHEGSKDKDEEHEDVTLGKKCDGCPNSRTIGQMQTSFGKLLRVGSLGGDV
ncbi:7902_t:CDS:2 [Funneliformis caledonium]|uniref:7902_t:CDS:1 n=1 Tax=Funneliformis caledonium TaxID=1117310 RepID=A0A9N9F4M4_9GLOM|nr:7902_t:CDS:2 [Funneliformis caledonium]